MSLRSAAPCNITVFGSIEYWPDRLCIDSCSRACGRWLLSRRRRGDLRKPLQCRRVRLQPSAEYHHRFAPQGNSVIISFLHPAYANIFYGYTYQADKKAGSCDGHDILFCVCILCNMVPLTLTGSPVLPRQVMSVKQLTSTPDAYHFFFANIVVSPPHTLLRNREKY